MGAYAILVVLIKFVYVTYSFIKKLTYFTSWKDCEWFESRMEYADETRRESHENFFRLKRVEDDLRELNNRITGKK